MTAGLLKISALLYTTSKYLTAVPPRLDASAARWKVAKGSHIDFATPHFVRALTLSHRLNKVCGLGNTAGWNMARQGIALDLCLSNPRVVASKHE
jgi:hypothetical protein